VPRFQRVREFAQAADDGLRESSVETTYLSGPAPRGGASVRLSRNNPIARVVPEVVTVREGQNTARFKVETEFRSNGGQVEVGNAATFEGEIRGALL
jgi:hypothetical protein